MDIIKTIFKLAFFMLGCVMLMLAMLVLPVGFKSFIWFFSFSLLFFGLSYKYTFWVIKYLFNTIKKLFQKISIKEEKIKNDWKNLKHENLSYNSFLKNIKLNSKIYDFSQIESIELISNSKKITIQELKKMDNIKSLEIKIGTKIKKVTYRHFKYITSKVSENNIKKFRKDAISDYKKLCFIFKKNLHKKN